MKIPPFAKMQHAADVANAETAGARQAALDDYVRHYGVTERTARRHAGVTVRAPRERTSPDPAREAKLAQLAALWLTTRTEKYPTATASLADVIDRGETAGIIEPHTVSVGQLRRYIERQHITLGEQRRPSPHVSLRTEHPNQVHLVDVTRCRQWYLRSDGRIDAQSYKRGTAAYRNKDLRSGVPLLRYVLVDHASGLPYVQYYTDETAPTLLTFLAAAWFPKRQRREAGPTGVERWWPAPFDPDRNDEWEQLPPLRDYPFRGVPRMLILDRASANQAGVTRRVCERLDVKHQVAQEARAKGAVERLMWIWETKFEAWLHVQPAPDLQTLNIWALDYLTRWCLKARHSRHGMTRTQAWALIQPEQLRELTGGWRVFRELATREPEPRTVKSGEPGCGRVYHGGQAWRLPDASLIGQTVHVWFTAFDQDKLLARCGDRVFELERLALDRFGFFERAVTIGEKYARQPDSETQKTEKRLEAVRAALPAPQLYGREAERRDTPSLIGPQRGVEIPVTHNAGAREISELLFTRRVRVALGGRPLTEEEGAERDRRWKGNKTLPESAVDEFVAWCLDREQAGHRKVASLFAR